MHDLLAIHHLKVEIASSCAYRQKLKYWASTDPIIQSFEQPEDQLEEVQHCPVGFVHCSNSLG